MANIPLSFRYYKKPSGSLSINANGTVDVTDYASAIVNVPTGGGGGGGAVESGVNFIDYARHNRSRQNPLP